MNGPSKADYVRSQGQTRDHHCHWPGCTQQVPPAFWGCQPHWYAIPPALRKRIWMTFDPGQEVSGRPSQAYLAAAQAVQEWIAARTKPDEGASTDQGWNEPSPPPTRLQQQTLF